MDSHVPSNRNDQLWTNEKHVHYLNSMEARFVLTMLENNSRHHNLRLDRHVPDSSESTLDCKQNQTRKKHSTSDFIGKSRSKMKGRPDKRSRRPIPPSSQPRDDSAQDQVVPEMETTTGDKDEKLDLPKVPVSSMSPAAN